MVMKLPEATDSVKGLVGTGSQTFGGKKVWIHPGGDGVKSLRYAGVFNIPTNGTQTNEDLNLTTLFGIAATTVVWGTVSFGTTNVQSGASSRSAGLLIWSAEVGTASSMINTGNSVHGSGLWTIVPQIAWQSTQTLRILAALPSGGGTMATDIKYVLDLHYT